METPPPINEEEIFQVAAALPSGERTAYLDAACGDDLSVRARIERRLGSHGDSRFVETPAAELNSELEVQLARLKPEESGERIGPYKLLQQLGEGGFGTVWMADQVEPVKRRVALKIIKMGMDTKEVIARFEQERQALAMMDHPNIAKVFDAGATQWGRPFFVMELVRGIPITAYCDERKLSIAERLALFIDVCHALQHAHQKGIIHRDLKPSNILVTAGDGDAPVPKIIDFGVAKAMDRTLTDKTLFTQFDQMIGTPAYMSPEQAGAGPMDIDTRSDIYSLGVVLYEMLTGKPPFDPMDLHRAGHEEMRRVIREQEPPRPSTRLSTLQEVDLTGIAAGRHVEPAKLAAIVRGDLDWIVMKALEKNRTRRYETVNGFALDLQRYLQSEPVLARPPSVSYLIRKFLRRRRREAILGAVLVFLIVSMGGLAFQLRRIHAERSAATLAKDRQEESELLSKVMAKLPLSDGEKGRAKACLARIFDRVIKGLGNETDHQLSARFLCRHVTLEGSSIQEIGKSNTRLSCSRGGDEYDVKGAGVILSATAGFDGVEVSLPMLSGTYLSGRSSAGTSGVSADLPLKKLAIQAGLHDISGEIQAQLVRGGRDGLAGPANGSEESIGKPVRIPLKPERRLFVRKMPADFPIEIVDTQVSESLRKGFKVRDATLSLEPNGMAHLKFTLTLPVSDHPIPMVLRMSLAMPGLNVTEVDLASLSVRELGGDITVSALANIRVELHGADSRTLYLYDFELLPLAPSSLAQSGEVKQQSVFILRSSRSRDLESFLSVPEMRETVMLTIQDRRGDVLKQREEVLTQRRNTLGPTHPQTTAAMIQLADSYAYSGHLDQALPLLAEASAVLPKDTELAQKVTALLAWLGQKNEQVAACRRILELAAKDDDLSAADRAVKGYCLLPSSDPQLLEVTLTLARRTVDRGKDHGYLPYFQLALGMAEYRHDNYAEADQALDASQQGGKDIKMLQVPTRLYHAMSLFRQGKQAEALNLFAEAEAKMKPLPADERKPLANGATPDDIITWLAYKEAKALLQAEAKE